MSLFITLPYKDRIELLTDGASYTNRGRAMMFSTKVWTSPHCPMAVTGRGSSGMVRSLATAFLGFAKCGSFSEALREIETRTDRWRMANAFKGRPFQMMIVGWSPETGFAQILFQSVPGSGVYEGLEPMRVNTIYGPFWGAPPVKEEDAAKILTPDRVPNGALDFGPELCKLARQSPDNVVGQDPNRLVYMVGGHIDFTRVDQFGATTQRLLTWPDKRFKTIDPSLPYTLAPTVPRPVPAPEMIETPKAATASDLSVTPAAVAA